MLFTTPFSHPIKIPFRSLCLEHKFLFLGFLWHSFSLISLNFAKQKVENGVFDSIKY